MSQSNTSTTEPTEQQKGEVGTQLRIGAIQQAPDMQSLRAIVAGLPPGDRNVCQAVLDRHEELAQSASQ